MKYKSNIIVIYLICFISSSWIPNTPLSTYPPCTSRSGYSYTTSIQQPPVQAISLNSYGGIPNNISGVY